jgi:hypothetical protein
MADERRKGPPERRRNRTTSAPQDGEQATTSAARDPNEAARFDADQLDESIRTRQQEDRGEVF